MASAAADIARRAKVAFDTAQASLPGGSEADEARNDALRRIRAKLQEAEAQVREANKKDMDVSGVCEGVLESS